MSENQTNLRCPIRGILKISGKSSDGLSFKEEFYRIEAIKYLLTKGYPKENFLIEPIVKRFGNSGRNSFRSDFAILKKPITEYPSHEPEIVLKDAIILCEVKRDNANNEYVKETQVKPMLDFAKNLETIGLYWDNLEHRVFWTELVNGVKETKEGPLSYIPPYGQKLNVKPLTYGTLKTPESLTNIFDRIEDILHQASFSPETRYETIMQLLLTKIFDEHEFETRPDVPLELQDFASLGINPELALKKYSSVMKRAITYYQKHLPNAISQDPRVKGYTLEEIMKILAPVRIIDAKLDIIQNFYMKFAKSMYKWDMAQYFTPTSVTDFIVRIINPKFGEHIADPACGSADFLVAAFRQGRRYNPGFADCIWGVDNSPNAVQVAILNMVLNGDGKSNIKKDDSLENIDSYAERYDIVLCNPPFGSKIVEKRTNVLNKFELARKPIFENDEIKLSEELLDSQESGILFIETCLREIRSGGRVAIILPNGYLGNRSYKFLAVRDWILRHARIAAIISLPRFTFKSSGADVSASVVFMEKLPSTVENISEIEDYRISVELIEKLGWSAGDSKGQPIYKKHEEDGSLELDENNDPMIDSDFDEIHNLIRNSDASIDFEWLGDINSANTLSPNEKQGWTINYSSIIKDSYLTLDPKRLCRKYLTLRNNLMLKNYKKLGDLVNFIPEKTNPDGSKSKINKSSNYYYVDLGNMGYGNYFSEEMKGWELPSRAKHLSKGGDLYFGSIWGSAVKWCYISDDETNIIVTNGCFRVRMKEGEEKYLPDILCYLNPIFRVVW